jgi:hypothetical protein
MLRENPNDENLCVSLVSTLGIEKMIVLSRHSHVGSIVYHFLEYDVLFYHGIIPSFFTRKNWHERTTATASLQLSSESRLDSAQALVPPLTCKNT